MNTKHEVHIYVHVHVKKLCWMFITINIQSRFVEEFPDGWLRMSEGVY